MNPAVDLAIKPFRAFDLLGLPFLKDWINLAITNALATTPIKVDLPQMEPDESSFLYRIVIHSVALEEIGRPRSGSIYLVPGTPREPIREITGMLHVKVMEAKRLPAADTVGTSDPYAIVQYEGQKQQTKTIKRNLNPSWGDSFEFKMKDGSPRKFTVTVYDWDQFGGDDLLGMFFVL